MEKFKIPSTKTPAGTITILLAMVAGSGMILGSWLGIWGIAILLAVLASFTSYYTSYVPAFHALILTNSWTGEMRVVFPGVNWKLPWEDEQDEYIDLRVELSEALSETYPSKDAKMEVKYVYTIRPNIKQSLGEDAGKKILQYSSFEPSAIKAKGRALFSMLLSDYYGLQEGKDLLSKEKINKEVFGTEENPKSIILNFEEKHGVQIAVRLEDSDFDSVTQKFRDTISGAKSFDEAVGVLISDRPLEDGTIVKGMERAQAEKIVKLMNLSGYSEQDLNLNIQAPHLTNLRDVTLMGGALPGIGKKKGGAK